MDSDGYPAAEARPRAVLVRNIPRLADEAAVDEFFSFCGTIESKRMRTIQPTNAGEESTIEAVVVFVDDASRRTALLMNESTILDSPVTITAVPSGYSISTVDATSQAPNAREGDESSIQHGTDAGVGTADQGSVPQGIGGFFGGVGGLFSSVSSAVSAEYRRAASVLDAATESGVLKTAKDQAELARKKTFEIIQHVDQTFLVQERAGAVADAVGTQTRNVASVVATQSKTFATQVDSTLQISENTKKLHERAMQNSTVSAGVSSVRSGIDTLLTQTGLVSEQNDQRSGSQQPVLTPHENGSNVPTAHVHDQ